MVATLTILLSNTTASRLPTLASVKRPKRLPPSCERVKLVSHLRNSSCPARALRISRPVITGLLLIRYHCSPSPPPRGRALTSLVFRGKTPSCCARPASRLVDGASLTPRV